MKKPILYVGIDVDDNAFHCHLIDDQTGEIFNFSCKPTSSALIKKLYKFKDQGCHLKVCYEATYLGFSLCRQLRDKDIECEVVASSLIPDVPGSKVKTNRLDSQRLSLYYKKGLLTFIYVPKIEDESERDLLRSRSFLVKQIKMLKCHIQSVCRRMNFNYKEESNKSRYWTVHHENWLDSKVKSMENKTLKVNLQNLLSTLNQLTQTVDYYNDQISQLAETPKYKEKVQALTCFRGIEQLTAMTLLTELGDIKRFSHPAKLTSYLGLDIKEYSTGNKEKKFGITKMGNKFARTALIESNQTASTPARVSRWLNRRRQGVEPKIISIADRCMKRLNKKSRILLGRGKNRNKVKVACAREMLGFLWEALHVVEAA